MPPKVHCPKRKTEATCLKDPDVCEWDGHKCVYKIKPTSPKSPKKKSPETEEVAPKKKSPEVEEVAPKKPAPKKAAPKKAAVAAAPVKAASPVKTATPVKTASADKSGFIGKLKNRHCAYYNDEKDLDFKETVDFSKREPYDPDYKSVTNVHMGQRKLLLSEIQLLTKYYKKYDEHPTVLYIGAAPGTHLLLLSSLFPEVKFILYDGAKFDINLKKQPDIFEIHEEMFTDEICATTSCDILISDIRLGADNREEFENGVFRDMNLQKTWVEVLKAKMSLLKFRMSYQLKAGEKIKYLKGDLLYGIWPKSQSAETRLLVHKKDIKKIVDYDFTSYEQSMFFHNKYNRAFCQKNIPDEFKKYIIEDNIYCSCYDCMSELMILYKYAELFELSFDNIVSIFGVRMNWQKKLSFQHNRIPVKLPLKKLDNL